MDTSIYFRISTSLSITFDSFNFMDAIWFHYTVTTNKPSPPKNINFIHFNLHKLAKLNNFLKKKKEITTYLSLIPWISSSFNLIRITIKCNISLRKALIGFAKFNDFAEVQTTNNIPCIIYKIYITFQNFLGEAKSIAK